MLKNSRKFLRNKWVKRTVAFFIGWIAVHIIYISIDGNNNYSGNADVAVILGNKVLADGSLSSWLQGRVDRALELYRQGKVKKIFASGGISKLEEGGQPEGNAMKNYLIKQGVPAEDIIADNAGQNTYLTAKDFITWNQQYHYKSVIVVSQFYHITRIKYIFHKLGYKNVFNASSKVYSWKDIEGTLREVPAFYKYLIFY
jgi:vancomycin permeability regulator SanA